MMAVGSPLACLQLDQAQYQLLVPASCARRLLVALLTDPSAEELGKIASRSPTLALWTSCQAHQSGSHVVFSGLEAGAWLADHWRQLAGLEDRLPAGAVEPVSPHAAGIRWQPGEDYAECLLGASLAQQADQPEGICRQAAWLALISRAESWLPAAAMSPPHSHGAAASDKLLPAGTLGLLRKMANDPGTRDPVVVLAWESLAQARQAWQDPDSRDSQMEQLCQQLSAWLPREDDDDELPDLAHAIGRLARIRALDQDFQRQLEHEKLLSLKELAYGAGHEINNPLANISTRAETLLRSEPDPEKRRLLAVIYSQAMRVNEMISDMMTFAKPPGVKSRDVDLVRVSLQAVREMQSLAEEHGVVLEGPADGHPLWVAGDADQLTEAIKAVCLNSLESCDLGGVVKVSVTEQPPLPTAERPTVSLEVCDNGAGVSPEARRHMFDPFYSGREAGRGLGFGLSKCWRIVGQHGGRVVVDDPPSGARVRIELPGLLSKAA